MYRNKYVEYLHALSERFTDPQGYDVSLDTTSLTSNDFPQRFLYEKLKRPAKAAFGRQFKRVAIYEFLSPLNGIADVRDLLSDPLNSEYVDFMFVGNCINGYDSIAIIEEKQKHGDTRGENVLRQKITNAWVQTNARWNKKEEAAGTRRFVRTIKDLNIKVLQGVNEGRKVGPRPVRSPYDAVIMAANFR